MDEVDISGEDIKMQARKTLEVEAAAILETANRVDGQWVDAIRLLAAHGGKIIISGIGKSGFIAQKIAATLTSTGKQTVFLHPTEALHGDLGIYSPGDPTLLISRSGATDELLTLVPILKSFHSPLIAIVGNRSSPLAVRCDYALEAYVDREADPLDLIPTTSAIGALAVGDAIAVVLMGMRKICREDFAKLHPGGQLGRSLLLRVADVMQPMPAIPHATPATPIREVLVRMTKNSLGACCIVDGEMRLCGIITDGDIRRLIQETENLRGIAAEDIMCREPRKIHSESQLGDAIRLMESGKTQVNVLPVLGNGNRLAGLLRLHDAYRRN
ncbi:MAG: KpsF/GutQ family sugar-phosphate isomerase [Puniceicoccales bacterium]|jgi:arabinose-5-phosphate isomerase|nr:KpsF/GutQ family sugar-phosphate isomerase [Puniceicoccales bacterium]